MANQPIEEEIRKRAYEIYVRTGCKSGRDLQNWLRAVREFMQGNPETKPAQFEQPKRKQVSRVAAAFERNGEFKKGF